MGMRTSTPTTTRTAMAAAPADPPLTPAMAAAPADRPLAPAMAAAPADRPVPAPAESLAAPATVAGPPAPAPGDGPGLPLLRLLQLASPSLPVGAYAYSEGLEQAVAWGWVHDEASTGGWVTGLLEHGLARLDVPLMARLHAAWASEDAGRARELSAWLIACRETAELRLTDRQLGQSLARVLAGLGVVEAEAWRRDDDASFAAMFALAAVRFQVPLADAAAALLWCWCEHVVAAAVKLVPLGQSAGQRLLFAAGGRIPALAAQGLALPDEDIAGAAPGLAIASAAHEVLHTRLFRS